MAHPPGITRHSTKTARNLRDHLLRSDRAEGRPTEAILQGRVWVRLDPFTRQSADGRYLRIADGWSRLLTRHCGSRSWTSQLGGKRAYKSSLGKDRSPGYTGHSIASVKKGSPP